MGLFGGIAGIFGATQEKRAAAEAARILQQAREDAVKEAGRISSEYAPFAQTALDAFATTSRYVSDDRALSLEDRAISLGAYREDRDLMTRLLADTERADLGQGFSTADEIALRDAQRLTNENLVGTGNLRSGAAGYANMELARRVTADVRQRQIGARLNQLSLLFGGAVQRTQMGSAMLGLVGDASRRVGSTTGVVANIGNAAGQIGVQGRGLAAQLYSASLDLAGGQASAELAKGRALSSQLTSGFMGLDAIAGAGVAAAGATDGGGNMAFLQSLFPTAKAA